jgi:hypothetical protein
MNNVASTKCLPGQIRFPNPNADIRTGSSSKLPSTFRKRSGLKASGSGYRAGSCKIALKSIQTILGQYIEEHIPTMHCQSRPRLESICGQKPSNFMKESEPTLWYEEAFIDVISCGRMWNSCREDVIHAIPQKPHKSKYYGNAPRGVIGCHLKVSLHTASMNGNMGRSSKVGSRSLPMTKSSSSWAFFCMSGKSNIATNNDIRAATVWYMMLRLPSMY